MTEENEEKFLSKAMSDGSGMTPDTARRIVAWLDKNANGWRNVSEETDVQD